MTHSDEMLAAIREFMRSGGSFDVMQETIESKFGPIDNVQFDRAVNLTITLMHDETEAGEHEVRALHLTHEILAPYWPAGGTLADAKAAFDKAAAESGQKRLTFDKVLAARLRPRERLAVIE